MAVKKRTATKAKAAKKKASQKTATAKKATRRARTVTVAFTCDNGKCTVSDEKVHISMGDTVILEARGTKVDLDFNGNSPFTLSNFSIGKDKSVSAGVMKLRGNFPYDLTCGACKVKGRGVPEFIVP